MHSFRPKLINAYCFSYIYAYTYIKSGHNVIPSLNPVHYDACEALQHSNILLLYPSFHLRPLFHSIFKLRKLAIFFELTM